MAGPWEKYEPRKPNGPWNRYQTAEPVSEPARSSASSLAMNAATGFNETLATILGAPVDLATGATNEAVDIVNWLGETRPLKGVLGKLPNAPEDLPGSSAWIQNRMTDVGVANPDDVVADTMPERIVRGLGQGVGYTLAPEAALGGLNRAGAVAPKVMDAAGRLFGRSESVAGVSGNALAGGMAGAGAEAGGEAVPEEYRTSAELAGGLAGGGVGVGLSAVPRAAGAAWRGATDFAAPFTQTGRERLAAETLDQAASSPSGLRSSLADGVTEIVPGSRPTTFQATGDMGIGGLERSAATQSPEAFMARRGEQNTARLDALSKVQPGGAADVVPTFLRGELRAIDQETQGILDTAATTARERAAALGGDGTPEAYGAALRGALDSAEQATRSRERSLWSAVDPDGTLALPAANLRTKAQEIRQGLPQSASPIAGEEAGIFEAAGRYGDVVPFSELTALRSRASTEMRRELFANGQSPSYARLSQLRAAIEQDLETAVGEKATQEARAVAMGVMSPEQTMTARIQEWTNVWREARNQNSASLGAAASGGAGALSSGHGARFQGEGRSGGAQGNSRLSQDALQPNFDEAALERLRSASTATKDRARTFKESAVGPLLRRSGRDGPWQVPAVVVPQRIFFPGPKSVDSIAAYRQAVGDEKALNTIQEYAASQLRRSAEREDGTLDPAKVARWRRRHQDALRAFPDLDRRFADAESASEAMAEAAASRTAMLDRAQLGTVGKLIGVSDPQDVTRIVGSIFGRQDSVEQMTRLREAVSSNPEALEGLRKAAVDHIANRFVSNTEVATSGQTGIKSDGFQTFVKQNRAALAKLFSSEEIEVMEAVAADLQQANRSLVSVRIPGQSNTAQDQAALAKTGGRAATILGRLMVGAAAGGAAGGGALTGSALTAAAMAAFGAAGAHVASSMRQAGIRTVDELVKDALLNPERARALLQAWPEKVTREAAISLGQRYRRAAASIIPPAMEDVTDPRAEIAELLSERGTVRTYLPTGVTDVADALMRQGAMR